VLYVSEKLFGERRFVRGRGINRPNINEDTSVFGKNHFQSPFKDIKKRFRNREISNTLAPQTCMVKGFTVIAGKFWGYLELFSFIAMREPPCVDTSSFDMQQFLA
jgi:hypothetical protein